MGCSFDLTAALLRHRVAVDLVEEQDGPQATRERLGHHELGLRERPLGRVDQEDGAVHHAQHALNLAAEVGVAGRIHSVHGVTAPRHGRVLGLNGDAPLALQRHRVHRPLRRRVAGAGNGRVAVALAHELIHERRLAVVDCRRTGVRWPPAHQPTLLAHRAR